MTADADAHFPIYQRHEQREATKGRTALEVHVTKMIAQVPDSIVEELRIFVDDKCPNSFWSTPLGISRNFVISDNCAEIMALSLLYSLSWQNTD